LQSALSNAAAAERVHGEQAALLEQQKAVVLAELEELRAQHAEGSAKLAELTAESASVKEHAKNQMQKAIEKIKALTATVDSKGQEVAQLQQNEVRLTEEIQQLRENEARLSSSSGEVAAALQVRVSELEQSEVSLAQQLEAARADTQEQIQALQGTLREGWHLGCDVKAGGSASASASASGM
jgi:chromosome segregation ATPase